jgi:outer membrane protein TolC
MLLGLAIAPAYAVDLALPVNIAVLKGSLAKTETAALTLKDALVMAEEANLSVKIADDVVHQAKARYRTRLAEMLPDIEVSYEISHYEGAAQPFFNGDFQLVNAIRNTYQPQLIFRFPVFQGGRHWFQARSAKHTLEAEKANAQTTLQQTLVQTAKAYLTLQQRLEEIGIAQQQMTEAQTQVQMNEARLAAGAGTRLDVLQSQAQEARAQRQLLESVRLSETAALRLNEFLNLPAFVEVTPSGENPEMHRLVPETWTMETLLHLAEVHRPELLSLIQQREALMSLRRVAWSAVLPEVNIEARTGGVGSSFDSIRPFDSATYGVGLALRNLAVPAWTRYQETSHQIDALDHRLAQIRQTLQRELSEAILETKSREMELTAARTEVAAAEQALTNATERLKVGVGRNIDILEAQTTLTRARTALSLIMLNYNQAQVQLVSALGMATTHTLTQGLFTP